MTDDAHMEQFADALDVADAPSPMSTLVIASTPRSGSHMLGHMLQQTGLFGVPFEYAMPDNLEVWKRKLGTKGLDDTLDAIMWRRTTRNGVFCIKLHYEHLQTFGGLAEALRRFPNPRLVRIVREDVLAQAISFVKASQTGIWLHGQAGNPDAASYDREAIHAALQKVVLDNASWSYDIAHAGLRAPTVIFEELLADLPSCARKVADHVGVAFDETSTPLAAATTRQSDKSERDTWKARYLSETNATTLRASLKQVKRQRGGLVRRAARALRT